MIPEDYKSKVHFCTFCKAYALKSSKHCAQCDRCVDGFDHHCRWINNCIGRKNYQTFFLTLVAVNLQLFLEIGIEIYLIVHYFSGTERREELLQRF